jgi:phenylalanyl-tRNA synthetase beta chain
MKISLNWLREYLDLDFPPEQIAGILTDIGLEAEGFEQVEQIRGSLRGLVVGEILTCVKHPNADRLSLTTVNIGNEILKIVCGAPNVSAGQKVVVAPVGTTLFDKEGKPWQINKGKIRGEVSEGMICAEDEIGLGEDHSGILVLNDSYVTGRLVADYFDTSSDFVFEIGLTPNRSDATSHIGVARDLLAALRINYQHKGQLHWPSVDHWKADDTSQTVSVEVLEPEGCTRYAGVTISDVTVRESPEWLRVRLKAIGVRPINNIVDITNYILHELGQPLHAFDLNRIGGRAIKVQTLPAGTSFMSLDEQERTLHAEDLMICDGDDKGMCIAGVFGGAGSGVTAGTKAIFLESAHFNARWIRRTSGRHLLFTDAARIFEKGSDPNICVYALKRAALMIREMAGGRITSEIVDVYPQPVLPREVTLRYHFLNRLVGTDIDSKEVISILEAQDMQIINKTSSAVTIAVPTNKVDVIREADVIEEILRIYGFNRIPISDRMSFSISAAGGLDEATLREKAAEYLYALGFQEIMGFSLIDKKYGEMPVFGLQETEIVRINNTSNIQMEVMRPNLLITAMETVRYNQYRQQNNLRLFEFGKSYRHDHGDYVERDHLTITIAGWSHETWLQQALPPKNEYYILKSVVENILAIFGIADYQWETREDSSWWLVQQYLIGDRPLVSFGEVSEELCEYMDIRGRVFFADFDWNYILSSQRVDQVTVEEPSRFPAVRRDLALVVDRDTSFVKIRSVIEKSLGEVVKDIGLFDVYRNEEVLGKGNKSYAVSILLSDSTKTFSDKEVDQMMGNLIQLLKKETGARLR